MRIGSLFTGYGGLDMATAEAFGAEVAWVSDIKPAACKLIEHRMPGVPNLGDITKINWPDVEPVQIITGGFPCTDISVAGKQLGMIDGTRSNLFHEVIRAARHLRPEWIVIENVRNLLSGKDAVDEPNDSCLCGWSRGWGGMHPDPGVEFDVPPPSDDRDDRESAPGTGVDAAALRRQDQNCTQGHAEVGRGTCVDSGGRRGHQPAIGHSAVSDLEVGTGAHSASGSGDSNGSAAPVAEPAGRATRMDTRSAATVRDLEAANARTERKRTIPGDGPVSGTVRCPACGGPVGDGSVRTVLRSWMGTVLRPLADLGFDAEWRGLRAADVGAPHGRYRVFIVAHADEAGLQGSQSPARTTPTRRFGHTQPSVDRSVDWGPYAPAIARWELHLGRPAPVPVDQRGRLNAALPEWMMGLPEGWITGVPGMRRTEALSLAGDGVVPQQALAAIRHMLNTYQHHERGAA